jgi:hypothetical protein
MIQKSKVMRSVNNLIWLLFCWLLGVIDLLVWAPKMQAITGHCSRLYLEKPTTKLLQSCDSSSMQKLSFKKKLVKKYINIKGQVKLVIESILVVN